MEILVILMLATVFFAIAMFIVSFIMVKKHHTDKVYAKGTDNLYLEDDDDDDDVADSVNNVNNNETVSSDGAVEDAIIKEETQEEVIIQEETIDVEKENSEPVEVEELIEEVEETPTEVKKDFDENTMVDIIVPIQENNDNKDVVQKVETDMQEVVNVLINKKNYMFLANGNKVTKGEHIKLVLNKKIYFGLITKGNYMRDIRPLKNKPYKLIIIKSNKTKKEEIEVLDTSDLEFVPKRKNQN